METYDVKSDCPKCGETNNGSNGNLYISTQFVAGMDRKGEPSATGSVGFMRRRCGRCAHTWNEMPLDQPRA